MQYTVCIQYTYQTVYMRFKVFQERNQPKKVSSTKTVTKDFKQNNPKTKLKFSTPLAQSLAPSCCKLRVAIGGFTPSEKQDLSKIIHLNLRRGHTIFKNHTAKSGTYQ